MTASAHDRHQGRDVAALMALDVRELGRLPGQAPRFVRRFTGSMDGLAGQLRREWGLNGHEMIAVGALWEFGPMPMYELSSRIPLSRAALTTLCDRLEGLELIKRVPVPGDRRSIRLEVTERVEQEIARVHGAWNSAVEAYVDQLDPAVWEAAVDVLADLRDLARKHVEELREQRPVTNGRVGADGGGKRLDR